MKNFRNFKKVFAFVLALTLILGMSTTAFAIQEGQEGPDYEDETQVRIDKDLTVSGGVNPAETFNFVIDNDEASGTRDGKDIDAPAFADDTFTIDVLQGATNGFTNINLPDFEEIGVYTYPITETAGDTAGFNYDDADEIYYLAITVIHDVDNPGEFIRVLTIYDGNDIKTDAFENPFEAGDLTIKKETAGNFDDPNHTFTVTVVLTPKADYTLNPDAILAAGGTKVISADKQTVTITYTVRDGSNFTIKNIPYDVSYKVTETGYGGYDPKYTVTYDGNEDGEMNSESIETTITNTRNAAIDTGINLDNLPYVMIIVIAAGGLVGFTLRRRFTNNK